MKDNFNLEEYKEMIYGCNKYNEYNNGYIDFGYGYSETDIPVGNVYPNTTTNFKIEVASSTGSPLTSILFGEKSLPIKKRKLLLVRKTRLSKPKKKK